MQQVRRDHPDDRAEERAQNARLGEHPAEDPRREPAAAAEVARYQPEARADDRDRKRHRLVSAEDEEQRILEQHVGTVAYPARRSARQHGGQQLVADQERQREEQAVSGRA